MCNYSKPSTKPRGYSPRHRVLGIRLIDKEKQKAAGLPIRVCETDEVNRLEITNHDDAKHGCAA